MCILRIMSKRHTIKNRNFMKIKHMTLIIIINALIASHACFGMNYMRSAYNSTVSMVASNVAAARDWTSNFYQGCKEIGVLPITAVTFGIYNFKMLTGLDEDKLNTYNSKELTIAIDRILNIKKYTGASEKLFRVYNLITTKHSQALDFEQAEREIKMVEQGYN